MSQGFKLRFDQMRESNPAQPETGQQQETNDGLYHLPGHARNLCFVWQDGRKFFLNYAYLIGGEFNTGAETNEIILNFSAYTVILKGYGLETLLLALLDHLPRIIEAVDPRYATGKEPEHSIVTEISVLKSE